MLRDIEFAQDLGELLLTELRSSPAGRPELRQTYGHVSSSIARTISRASPVCRVRGSRHTRSSTIRV